MERERDRNREVDMDFVDMDFWGLEQLSSSCPSFSSSLDLCSFPLLTAPPARSKSSLSCDQCSASHKKCDGCSPCSRCTLKNLDTCSYSRKGKRGPKKKQKTMRSSSSLSSSQKKRGMDSGSHHPLDLLVPLVSNTYQRSVFMECISSFRANVVPLCGLQLISDIVVDPFVTQEPERRFLAMAMAATGAMMCKGDYPGIGQGFFDTGYKILAIDLANQSSMRIAHGLTLMSYFQMAKSKPLDAESLMVKAYSAAEALSMQLDSPGVHILMSQCLCGFFFSATREERYHYFQKGYNLATEPCIFLSMATDFLTSELQFSLSGGDWIGAESFHLLLEELDQLAASPGFIENQKGWVCRTYKIIIEAIKAVMAFKEGHMERFKKLSNEVIQSIKNEEDVDKPCLIKGMSLLSLLVICVAGGEIELFMESFLLLQKKVGSFVGELPPRSSFAWVKDCFPASFGSVLDQLLYSPTWTWVNGWFRGMKLDTVLQQFSQTTQIHIPFASILSPTQDYSAIQSASA